jgi:hypothetical protein
LFSTLSDDSHGMVDRQGGSVPLSCRVTLLLEEEDLVKISSNSAWLLQALVKQADQY